MVKQQYPIPKFQLMMPQLDKQEVSGGVKGVTNNLHTLPSLMEAHNKGEHLKKRSVESSDICYGSCWKCQYKYFLPLERESGFSLEQGSTAHHS